MHYKKVRDTGSEGERYDMPYPVADEDDLKCDCGRIVEPDDVVMCTSCEHDFCSGCMWRIDTDQKGRPIRTGLCYNCYDDLHSVHRTALVASLKLLGQKVLAERTDNFFRRQQCES